MDINDRKMHLEVDKEFVTKEIVNPDVADPDFVDVGLLHPDNSADVPILTVVIDKKR